MICFNRDFLTALGMTEAELRKIEDGAGLAVSPLFVFGDRGSPGAAGFDTDALEEEPAPRALVLVGMADRLGAGAKRAEIVVELCIDGESHRPPTKAEVVEIFKTLRLCTNEHAALIGHVLQAAVE